MYFPSEAPFALSPGNHGKRSSQAPIMLAITLKVRVQARLTPGMFRKTSRWLAVGAGGLSARLQPPAPVLQVSARPEPCAQHLVEPFHQTAHIGRRKAPFYAIPYSRPRSNPPAPVIKLTHGDGIDPLACAGHDHTGQIHSPPPPCLPTNAENSNVHLIARARRLRLSKVFLPSGESK